MSSHAPNQQASVPYNDPASSSTRKSSPKIVGQKFEDGVLKIIYDPRDLKRYREENGLAEPQGPETPNDSLPLLPVTSGGHETPSSEPSLTLRRASLAGSQSTLPTSPRLARTNRSSFPAEQYRSAPNVNLVPVPVPFSPPDSTIHRPIDFSKQPQGFCYQHQSGPPDQRLYHMNAAQPSCLDQRGVMRHLSVQPQQRNPPPQGGSERYSRPGRGDAAGRAEGRVGGGEQELVRVMTIGSRTKKERSIQRKLLGEDDKRGFKSKNKFGDTLGLRRY